MAQNISIIGLGKLGSCMVAAYAHKNHNVVGVDINPNFVISLNAKKAPVQETDLQKYIDSNKERIRATHDYKDAILDSDITFIIVPTPTDETGGFSVAYVQEACKEIGSGLKHKKEYHLVVLTSTVLPMDCQTKIIPVLEKYSGKKCGPDFGFCYSPEFIAIGSVIRDLLNPDMFLIGEFDKRSGDMLESFYSTSSDNHAPIKRMSIPSAELTKISLNHFLTTKITFANMLAEIAHNIPSVHIDKVTDALGSDTRIGSKYLRGGLGYGGPCFPRDNRAFASVAEKIGIDVPYAKHTDIYNSSIPAKMVTWIISMITPLSKIGIVGLSYKPGTGFCEESQGIRIAQMLADKGYTVHVFEPHGLSHAKTLLGEAVHYKDTLDEIVDDSDAIFLTNWDKNNHQLRDRKYERKIVIIDPWRHFSADAFEDPVEYISFGIGL